MITNLQFPVCTDIHTVMNKPLLMSNIKNKEEAHSPPLVVQTTLKDNSGSEYSKILKSML